MPTFGLYVTNPLREEKPVDFRDAMPSGIYTNDTPLAETITRAAPASTEK